MGRDWSELDYLWGPSVRGLGPIWISRPSPQRTRPLTKRRLILYLVEICVRQPWLDLAPHQLCRRRPEARECKSGLAGNLPLASAAECLSRPAPPGERDRNCESDMGNAARFKEMVRRHPQCCNGRASGAGGCFVASALPCGRTGGHPSRCRWLATPPSTFVCLGSTGGLQPCWNFGCAHSPTRF